MYVQQCIIMWDGRSMTEAERGGTREGIRQKICETEWETYYYIDILFLAQFVLFISYK